MIDAGPEFTWDGRRRNLASEDEFALLTSYIVGDVVFSVDATVLYDGSATVLEFADMVARSAAAVERGEQAEILPAYGARHWSVGPSRGDRVTLGFSRYVRGERRDVTGSVSVGRAPALSAWSSFALRSLDEIGRYEPSVIDNPWTRRTRAAMTALNDRWLDRTVVEVTSAGANDAVAAILARRLWSYGGPPDGLPAPVTVEAVTDPDAERCEVTGAEVDGLPYVEAILPEGVADDADAFADAVWPGFADVLEIFGSTGHPLDRASRRGR